MAKVSIIVPIYNVEQYLEKCLKSLINQTFKDIEILAISDGSLDNSVEIIKKYQKKDKRVKCIEKENGGYGSVLEYAIKNIKSKYFLICDPDDWLSEDAIEILVNGAEKNKVDLVVGAKYLVYNDSEDEKVYDNTLIKGVNIEIISDKKYTKEEKGKALFLYPSPHAKLYTTKFAKKIKFPERVSFTDFLLYTLYINECNSFMYLSTPLAYYLVDRPGNSMTDISPKTCDYHYTVFLSVLDQAKKQNIVNYFYSYLLLHLRYIFTESKKIKDINIRSEKQKKLYDLLRLLQNYKKEINRYNNLYEKKIGLYNRLLLNKLTSKIFYKRFIK